MAFSKTDIIYGILEFWVITILLILRFFMVRDILQHPIWNHFDYLNETPENVCGKQYGLGKYSVGERAGAAA